MRLDPRASTDAIWLLILVGWLVALAATLGALFIGEVMGQTPCVLCWYQRAFMFPLAFVLAVACYRTDGAVWVYALPLSVIGLTISGYHSLLYAGIIPESISPCGQGPSCASSEMTILGSLPIPILSVAAFLAVTVILLLVRRKSNP